MEQDSWLYFGGLLDKCTDCDTVAMFKLNYSGEQWRAGCTECANTSDWFDAPDLAMVQWNKMQRGLQIA